MEELYNNDYSVTNDQNSVTDGAEVFYNKHYIMTDDRNRITEGWSDGIFPDRTHPDAVCINEQGGYQFRLKFPDGTLSEENPMLFHAVYPVPLYAYENGAVRVRTQEEIDADIADIPEPEPTPTVWDELDAAYREGVNSAYGQ